MSSMLTVLRRVVSRYDPLVLPEDAPQARVALVAEGRGTWHVLLEGQRARIRPEAGRPDAVITAGVETWEQLAAEQVSGLGAYLDGSLSVRRNLHLGVGLLAAVSGPRGPAQLRFRSIATRRLRLSTVEAGDGPPMLAVHGLGATKGSFLPSVVALSDRFRVIALDLPGFGDSDKPIGASYDPEFFAAACGDLLDALDLPHVHLLGNSLGGRIALEIALRHPDRVDRIALLAPSLAWRKARHLVPLVRLARPELGLIPVAPRPLIEGIVRRLIPGAQEGWVAAGVDEFLRAYLTPAGRAAFYAAARHIYLEEPLGPDGFWPRLAKVQAESMFVWGRRDRVVPLAFARHVAKALPHSHQLELECGHVPQIERPAQTHEALVSFFLHGHPAGSAATTAKPTDVSYAA
jgi:pimeloyl-ACP methyl ester carboxylesterase